MDSKTIEVVFSDDQLLPISALQHFLFCPRQMALIHLEQVWADNVFTAEGNMLHKQAHEGHDESRSGVRITRTLPVMSKHLGITGQCDIVEFHNNGAIVPVEYKRSAPKSHDADRVQLCAQAMCLEEMLSVKIPQGFLFYGLRKRRTTVEFNTGLRQLVETIVKESRNLIRAQVTPKAEFNPKRCESCSLIEICQPKILSIKGGAATWFATALTRQTPYDPG